MVSIVACQAPILGRWRRAGDQPLSAAAPTAVPSPNELLCDVGQPVSLPRPALITTYVSAACIQSTAVFTCQPAAVVIVRLSLQAVLGGPPTFATRLRFVP